MTRRTFTLVPVESSEDTIQALQELLLQARKGDLIGIVFAAMARNKRYFIGSAGEATNSPTFSLGMVQMLARSLEDQALGRET